MEVVSASGELILRVAARDLVSSESMPFLDKGTGGFVRGDFDLQSFSTHQLLRLGRRKATCMRMK
jgi:hypothetical protein